MSKPLKVLLIDDDPWFFKIFEKRFQKRFPEHTIESRQSPDPVEGFDVYVIDNDFKGTSQLPKLASVLLSRKPQPVVFGLSGTLDETKRKEFQKSGCKDAFEKANPDDLERLFLGISECLPLNQTAAIQEGSSGPFKVLLIDDDPDVHRIFGAQFRRRYPNIQLDLSLNPVINQGYDVFVIDNEFEGGKFAGKLAQIIRKQYPDAVVIAHSATLDAQTLKSLLTQGCSGACEKGNPDDLEVLFKLIGQTAEEKSKKTNPQPLAQTTPQRNSAADRATPAGKGLMAALRTAADLLREWNTRLDQK